MAARPNVDAFDRDSILARSSLYQHAVTELFKNIYPDQTYEDKIVRRIMCEIPCLNSFLIRSQATSGDVLGLDCKHIPIICTALFDGPFDRVDPIDDLDRELIARRLALQHEFYIVLATLDQAGADFDQLLEEGKSDLVRAAQVYARLMASYESRKHNELDEGRRTVLQHIPYMHALSLGKKEVKTRRCWFAIQCDFYGLFDRPLTPHLSMFITSSCHENELDVIDFILNLRHHPEDDAFYAHRLEE